MARYLPNLSNALIAKIKESILSGAPLELAATVAGVHRSILMEWMQEGNKIRQHMLKHGAYPEGSSKQDWLRAKLVEECELATATVACEYIKVVHGATRGKNGWCAAAWWLDRRGKEFFSTAAPKAQENNNQPQVVIHVPDNGRGPKS